MAILSGKRLGPYEILSAIGAGGMGEVYRARDTRLERIVAVKILPDHLSDRAELRERFEREARTVASLNHPHICTLHDIGHQDGTDFLVMEYLEGETLAERLKKGPLPLAQVLQYAIEISDALDKAHRKGITHRDLKPGNIMLTKTGTKLLDFGLAKLRASSVTSPLSQLPTANDNMTAQGTILGTLQYMAPEQLEGKEADSRTDIFAFGVVVYEMATGKKAFEGKSEASLIAKILETDPPPLSSLQPMTPPALDRVVKICLAKEPDERWQAATDLCRELKWIAEDGSHVAMPASAEASRTGPLSNTRVAWALTAIAVVAALALGTFAHLHRTTEEPDVIKLSVLPPEKASFNVRSIPAVSPNGRRLAFVATLDGKNELWVRDLDSLAARPLSGTDGADHPFWSPDSHFIAFFASGKLKKIDVAGGPGVSLCDAAIGGTGYGGSWSKNDVILFSPAGNVGLFRVSVAGGNATPVTTLNQAGEMSHRFPWFLPDGHHFLYTAVTSDPEKSAVYVGDLDSKNRRQIVAGNNNAVYVPPGFVLFVREHTLMAQPFDPTKLQTSGDPAPIAEGVDLSSVNAQSQFSSSQNGVLAYTSGEFGTESMLTWFDRNGKVLGTVGTPGNVLWPAISPDGNTVVVDRRDPQTGYFDLWLQDLVRGTASRLTFNPKSNEFPVWSADGSHIAFTSLRDGAGNLYQKTATGAAQDEALDKAARGKRADDWSRDGRYIIEERFSDPGTGFDIWILPVFGDRKPFPYLQTEFNERWAKLSPNGEWLAYVSDETKRNEVYVQTFPTPGGKWQVSTNGGDRPLWSRDGKELFFIGGDQKLMAVEVKGDTAKGVAKFEADLPKPLFDTRIPFFGWFDVSKDGRFLMPAPVEQSANVPISVVVNWTAGLKK